MRKENYFTAIKLALVVGTILNLINSKELLFNGGWSDEQTLKILLTYSVPFFVSIYSSWKATKR